MPTVVATANPRQKVQSAQTEEEKKTSRTRIGARESGTKWQKRKLSSGLCVTVNNKDRL